MTIKHIDYEREKATTLKVEKPFDFARGVRGINVRKDLDFSDHFVVFRNTSKYNSSHPYRLAVEMTYQVSGTNLNVLRVRNLSLNNVTNLSLAK